MDNGISAVRTYIYTHIQITTYIEIKWKICISCQLSKEVKHIYCYLACCSDASYIWCLFIVENLVLLKVEILTKTNTKYYNGHEHFHFRCHCGKCCSMAIRWCLAILYTYIYKDHFAHMIFLLFICIFSSSISIQSTLRRDELQFRPKIRILLQFKSNSTNKRNTYIIQ